MDHSTMDHSKMNHSTMDHSMMGHSTMDHSMMDHSTMDHSMMDHSMMNHSKMDHSAHSMMDHSAMNDAGMDHSTMNLTGMNHTGMNHSSTDHSMMDHSMTFHFGDIETVLFNGWEVRGVSTMLLSCFGIFVVAFIYEGIKYYRENLLWRTYNALHYRAVGGNPVPDAENHETVVREVIRKEAPKMFSKKHIVQTGLHIVQLTVSYLLMLIFMTYNVWLCLAVVAGSATGYFMFGWKRTVVVDMTETCH